MKKNIIISGASRGIGRAITVKLMQSGYRVAAIAKEINGLETLKKDLAEFGEIRIFPLDLAKPAEIKEFCDNWPEDLYGIVNNAGICRTERLDEDKGVWDEVLAVNLAGPYHLTKGLLPRLLDRGRIINISSQLGVEGRAGYSAYCASKFALNGLTKCWAKELGVRGITVNSICPGWVRTEMAENDLGRIAAEKGLSRDEFYRQICEPLELKRFTEPEEVADLAEFLLSPKGSGISGRDWLMNTIWNQE